MDAELLEGPGTRCAPIGRHRPDLDGDFRRNDPDVCRLLPEIGALIVFEHVLDMPKGSPWALNVGRGFSP